LNVNIEGEKNADTAEKTRDFKHLAASDTMMDSLKKKAVML
jgi:hypothetical protein